MPIEITFLRAAKVWWSFIWRAWILMLPLGLLFFPLMYLVVTIPHPGSPPPALRPDQMPGFIAKFFVLWIVMMGGMVCVQTLAIRWMLKTKWSDFKLVAVPIDEQEHNTGPKPS
jgi:hypothetical protein